MGFLESGDKDPICFKFVEISGDSVVFWLGTVENLKIRYSSNKALTLDVDKEDLF